jgi:hypothetical protein
MSALEQRLDQAVPGWQAIVVSPQFLDWATRIGPRMYGSTWRPRQQVLDDAVRAGDVATVIQLLREFEAYRSGAPSRSRIPTYTREQVRRGEFAGREMEWARLEADFIRAAREGRIPNGVPLAKNFGDGR